MHVDDKMMTMYFSSPRCALSQHLHQDFTILDHLIMKGAIFVTIAWVVPSQNNDSNKLRILVCGRKPISKLCAIVAQMVGNEPSFFGALR